ncbi:MAG: fatty-acyl-CoA synthase, partial [Actinomycetota bacterium]
GGEKVWPDPVEAVLRSVPGVVDVAVTGVADPQWGHRVVAHVVAGETEMPSLEQLREAVKAVLPAYCAPKQLLIVAAIPRTALGKVRRAALRAHED